MCLCAFGFNNPTTFVLPMHDDRKRLTGTPRRLIPGWNIPSGTPGRHGGKPIDMSAPGGREGFAPRGGIGGGGWRLFCGGNCWWRAPLSETGDFASTRLLVEQRSGGASLPFLFFWAVRRRYALFTCVSLCPCAVGWFVEILCCARFVPRPLPSAV